MTAGPTPTTTSSDPRHRGEAVDRRSLALAAIAVASLGLALLWLVVVAVRFSQGAWVDGTWTYVADDAWAFDLEAYLEAARRLVSDGSLYASGLVEGSFRPGSAGLFYYAPPVGVAMLPLLDVPVTVVSLAWYALRVAALIAACALMPVRPLVRVIAFAIVAFSFPVLKDAVLGNVSLLITLPLVIAWRSIDRPVGSVGLAIGIALRPSLGVFLVWQALRREWTALAWTVGAGLALIVLTLPWVGIDGYRDFVAVLGNLQVPGLGSENRDFGTVLGTLGGGEAAVGIGRLVAIGLGVGAMVLSLGRDREVGFMVTLGASLLVTPLLWITTLVALLLPAAFLADRVRLVAVLLPLLGWLPGVFLPFVALAVTFLPFVVRPRSDPAEAAPQLVATHPGSGA